MSNFKINFDWENPEAARGAELRATWARLEVVVDGNLVTRVLDEDYNSVRGGIYTPLLPVAEWIAENWWSLFHELDSNERAPSYEQRHLLRSGREGFALPALEFHSHGEQVELTWERFHSATERVEFLSAGSARFHRDEVEAELRRLVDAVVSRLADKGITDSWLVSEWQTINELSVEEEDYCQVVAALGLHPFEIDESMRDIIVELSSGVPFSLFYDMCTVSNENNYKRHLDWLKTTVDQLRRSRSEFMKLRDLRNSMNGYVPSESETPWKQGYQFARLLREKLGLNSDNRSLRHMSSLLQFVSGSSSPNQDIEGLCYSTSPSKSINVCMSVDSESIPRFAVFGKRQNAKKFSFCRALGEYFFVKPDTDTLITESRSTTQQRNRAFAAEFLAPSDILRQEVSGDLVAQDEIEDLASRFGVSTYAIEHQIDNHGIAKLASAHG